jgi:hypothetical protein
MVAATRTDARTRASVEALREALGWYSAHAAHDPRSPLDPNHIATLEAALDGRGAVRWEPALFDAFVTFGRVMHVLGRTAGVVPPCNVGDVLTGLTALPSTATEVPWSSDVAVDPPTFAKLGFAAISRGIALAKANNESGWLAHAQRSRAFIEEAAALPARKDLAVLLGVGQGFDLPLAKLARDFATLVLVDIDCATLDATVAATFEDAATRARVETRVIDLTGISRGMISGIDEIAAAAGDAAMARSRLETFIRSYRLAETPSALRLGERADLLVSGCVMSQLTWAQRAYAQSVFERRFGGLRGDAEESWRRAWFELELRLQQDHINGLAGSADVSVLVVDTTSHATALDAAGAERLTGEKVFTIGVDSLAERIPRMLRVERHAAWPWPRYRPGPNGERGALMQVEAAVLREAVTAGGLWLQRA